ncbi:unnamed protein product [Lactuca saligna]|uniref:Uncharacterized protein n=1 Tax=Lactuca saligna TaxID=75948 RepID=A0AA35ZGP2_LACSI|nr:unnamed protein product [Lactuca saligna]
MREFVGLLSVEGGNIGSNRPTSPSQLGVRVVSPVRLPAPASLVLPVDVQAKKGTAPIQKRQILRVVLSSDKETESNDAGHCPRKMHKTVSIAKLLGGIDNVLGDRFSMPGQKEKEVVPSFQSHRLCHLPVYSQLISVPAPCLGVYSAHLEVLPNRRSLPRLTRPMLRGRRY